MVEGLIVLAIIVVGVVILVALLDDLLAERPLSRSQPLGHAGVGDGREAGAD